MYKFILISFICFFTTGSFAQSGSLGGTVSNGTNPIPGASASLIGTNFRIKTDSLGQYLFKAIKPGKYHVRITAVGFDPTVRSVSVLADSNLVVDLSLTENTRSLNDVVVTGTLKAVSRLESPVPVEVYRPSYFRKNPTPNLFDAVGSINGVRPQLNCNVCNTGDIQINGLPGAYTMILIDGMPIVSSLSTVYGLSGIPNSLVERLEVVKGPGSSLYGSEAIGGIINIITKNPVTAPRLTADFFGTTWGEYNFDGSLKFGNSKVQNLIGVNYFNFQNRIDRNRDGFTDLTLQNRISLFNKLNFIRRESRVASFAARYVYEDRWGGQTNWEKTLRGSGEVYGESIYTKRFEVIGAYQLPFKEHIMMQLSYNWHDQNSYYGTKPYLANQQVAFTQLYWDKQFGLNHSFLLGAAFRYTHYDDNTPATSSADGKTNAPAKTPLPGAFIQDEWKLSAKQSLLLGYRYDYDQYHGNIHSPRLAYKLAPNANHTIRASFGTGFRVVNLFTEDHAALTGARQVIIEEQLNPEKSYNANINYVLKTQGEQIASNLDFTAFYSYFTNRIIGDFDTDPDQIVYRNLNGHAVSRGLSVNSNFIFSFPLEVIAGITYMDVYQMNSGEKIRQLHAPKWSGNYSFSYTFPKDYTIDLTGTFNGPMRLPIQPNDYRPEYSPWFTLANIQLTKKFQNGLELYGGIKNLLNFVPKYALIRSFDPFDKTADDPVSNPKGYTFDTEYNYAPLQGIRGFAGIRYTVK